MEKQAMMGVAFARQLRNFATLSNQPRVMNSTTCNEAAWKVLLELFALAEDLVEASAEDIALAIDLPLTQVLRVAIPLRNAGLIWIYSGATVADMRIGLSDLGYAQVDTVLTGASSAFSGAVMSVAG